MMSAEKKKLSPNVRLSLWAGFGGLASLVLNYIGNSDAYNQSWLIFASAVTVIMLFLVPWFPLTVWAAYQVLYFYIMAHEIVGVPALILMACLMGGLVAYCGHLKAAILGGIFICYFGSIDIFEGVYFPDDLLALMINALAVGLPIGIGFTFHHTGGQRKDLMREWDRDIQRRRETVGRQLHDSVASSLTSLIMRLEGMSLREDLPSQAREELIELAGQARTSMKEVRGLLRALSTDDAPRENKPAPSITAQLQKTTHQLKEHGFTVKTTGNSPATRLSADELIVLKEVFGELATNIVKYAEPASTVTIDFKDSNEGIHVSFANAITTERKPSHLSTDMGLPALAQLMESIGGSIATTSNSESWLTELELTTC